jgi:hypothetical protein
MKNKTLAAWLALLVGPLGMHRFYLKGLSDLTGWMLTIPTLAGLYGITRMQRWGVEDSWGTLLAPLLGFTIAACALNAIVLGLMDEKNWNQRYNQQKPINDPNGCTNWLTVGALVTSLFIGSTALMATLAFSFQRYFEYQT